MRSSTSRHSGGISKKRNANSSSSSSSRCYLTTCPTVNTMPATAALSLPKQQQKVLLRRLLFWGTLLGLALLVQSSSSTSSSSSTTTSSASSTSSASTRSLPRSHNGRTTSVNSSSSSSRSSSSSSSSQQQQQQQQQSSSSSSQYPPWNPSHKIRRDGFLQDLYRRIPGEWEKEIRLNTIHRLVAHDTSSSSSSSSSSRYNVNKNDHTDTSSNDSNGFWCQIRQVPGDGNCLFHSISLCLHHSTNNGSHWNLSGSNNNNNNKKSSSSSSSSSTSNGDDHSHGSSFGLQDLYAHSQKLRHDAVACLRQGHRRLVLQGPERLACRELVHAAASQYGLSSAEYCDAMAQDSVWGGGPEIVALCNLLQRPIHVYELAVMEEQQDEAYRHRKKRKSSSTNAILASSTSSSATIYDDDGDDSSLLQSLQRPSSQQPQQQCSFVLRRMACFGSPRFDRRQPLHILSADSRFPDLEPGQHLAAGNHFLAVFPIVDRGNKMERRRRRRKRIRGGGIKKNHPNNDDDDDDHVLDNDDENEDLDSCHNARGGLWSWLNLWRRLL
jgi:OTU-like cysteine protease